MKSKTYKVDLLPEDFIECNFGSICDCALTRALRRKFRGDFELKSDVFCGETTAQVGHRSFEIVDGFHEDDFDFVREKYENLNHDTIYYVTLKEYLHEHKNENKSN